ncbi:MAG: hypothetical protein H0W71_08410 [Sphingomonas sp.]|nr:hypothetical protein [Sphingomonas sp.]
MGLAKFKPLDGWRQFFGEVGIIVLGVVIALGLEQAILQWNWSNKVERSRQTLREELMTDYLLAEERVAAKPCLMAQLDSLENAVLKARGEMTPVPLIVEPDFVFAYRAPWEPWHDTAWKGVEADEMLSHFSRDERENYAAVHGEIDMLSKLNEDESTEQAKLLGLTKPLDIDPTIKNHYVELIESEREKGELMAVLSRSVMKQAEGIGAVPSASRRREFLDRESTTLAYCRRHNLPIAKA